MILGTGEGKMKLVALLAALAAFALTGTAHADAIDGHWCKDSRRIEIAGSSVVTPGGNRITGEYGRHDFSYIVPAGETDAGRTVDMDLLGDEEMRLWPAGRMPDPEKGRAELWHRCPARMS